LQSTKFAKNASHDSSPLNFDAALSSSLFCQRAYSHLDPNVLSLDIGKNSLEHQQLRDCSLVYLFLEMNSSGY